MRSLDEQVLKVTKEIVAKFIEVGRISPASFDDTFKSIYKSVKEAVIDHSVQEEDRNTTLEGSQPASFSIKIAAKPKNETGALPPGECIAHIPRLTVPFLPSEAPETWPISQEAEVLFPCPCTGRDSTP